VTKIGLRQERSRGRRKQGEVSDRAHAPPLLKAALAHVQFETIHPFLRWQRPHRAPADTLLLCHEAYCSSRLLYLSLHLKQRCKEYYECFQRVRLEVSERNGWNFFFDGSRRRPEQSADTRGASCAFYRKTSRNSLPPRGPPRSCACMGLLQRQPMLTVNRTLSLMEDAPTFATVNNGLSRLASLGLAEKKRPPLSRVPYKEYLAIFSAGTEPI